jgi:hypothetical protein
MQVLEEEHRRINRKKPKNVGMMKKQIWNKLKLKLTDQLLKPKPLQLPKRFVKVAHTERETHDKSLILRTNPSKESLNDRASKVV